MAESENNQADEMDPLDRELKRLPEFKAPPSIAATVLSSIRRWESRPWWQRSWFEWPAGLRYASMGLFVGAILGIYHFGSVAEAPMALQPALALIGALEALVVATFTAFSEWVGRVPVWIWAVIALAAALAWMVCLGLGAVAYQLIRWRK
jgi:hypothetical protein